MKFSSRHGTETVPPAINSRAISDVGDSQSPAVCDLNGTLLSDVFDPRLGQIVEQFHQRHEQRDHDKPDDETENDHHHRFQEAD